jgi:hypothetical protein
MTFTRRTRVAVGAGAGLALVALAGVYLAVRDEDRTPDPPSALSCGPTAGASACPSARPALPAGQFPTAATTGPLAGTAFVRVTGDLASSAAGQVIRNKLIEGDFIAGDANVTLQNSRVLGRIVNENKGGLRIVDSDIGPDACPSGPSDYNELGGTNYELLRSHVHNSGADLIGIGGDGTIKITESLIDQACFYPGDHLDGVQFYAPGALGHVTISRTAIDTKPVNSPEKGNAAIFWADEADPSSTLIVKNSYLAGGNYTLQMRTRAVFSVTDTTFEAGNWVYGPCYTDAPGVVFTGNKLTDGRPLKSC